MYGMTTFVRKGRCTKKGRDENVNLNTQLKRGLPTYSNKYYFYSRGLG